MRVDLGEREPAFSFMSRLAARNELRPVEFGAEFSIPFAKVILGDAQACRGLAALGGVDPDQLMAWTPVHRGDRAHVFRDETFHARGIKDTTLRGCPACLRDDIASTGLPPSSAMRIRGEWLFTHLRCCPTHDLSLAELWREPKPLARYDTASQFARISNVILDDRLQAEAREPSAFEDYAHDRLMHGPGSRWLDRFELHPLSVFCDLLGRALLKLEGLGLQHVHPASRWALPAMGFEIAGEGEVAVRAALTRLQESLEIPQATPKAAFGDLYDRLTYDLASKAYAPFRELLRDHIQSTWPLGPGDDLMGEPVLARRRHSVLTAARELGVDPRKMRKILVERGIVRPLEVGRSNAWEQFDAEAAEPVLDGIRSLVSGETIQSSLSISRSQFDLLRVDGFLPSASGGDGLKPLWDAREANRYIERLLLGAIPVHVKMTTWSDIPSVSKALWIRPGEVVRMILDGRLRRVGSYSQATGYLSILVDGTEVAANVVRGPTPGMTVEAFARAVGLRPAQLYRLIRAGHLPSTAGPNSVRRAIQPYLSADDQAAFDDRFITLRTLALEASDTWQRLRPRLEMAGLRPFIPDGLDCGPVYERRDIEARLICRWPRRDAAPVWERELSRPE